MTADIRANEPTHEQVEAAAEELASYEWVNWEAVPSSIKDRYIDQARAVLEAAERAAQGAAPPVNSFDTTAERVKTGADSLHVTPVQPSSGVDEDALAEVVCLALNHRDGGDECEDDYRVARAVAEWLKGQGR